MQWFIVCPQIEAGEINHQVFNSNDIDIFNQSWSMDFDQYGRMYVANTASIVAFDGVRWQSWSNFQLGIIRSVVVTDSDKIFAGGQNAIGYYSTDDTATWQFHKVPIPESFGHIGAIWRGLEHNKKVYFAADNYLIVIDENNQVEGVASEGRVSIGQAANLVWAYLPGKGLFELNNHTLSPILPSQTERIMGVFPSAEGFLLVFRNGEIKQLATNSSTSDMQSIPNPELAGQIIINVTEIPGGLGVTTAHNGLVILDNKGNTIEHIKLRETWTLDVQYSNGHLWIAHDGTMLSVPWPKLAERFTIAEGMSNRVESIALYNNELYVGTNNGLFKKNNASAQFEPIFTSELETTIWRLEVSPAGLLILGQQGIYLLKEKKAELILSGQFRGIGKLHTPNNHYVVASFTRGVYLLNTSQRGVEVISHSQAITDDILTVAQDNQGYIYLGSRKNGVHRITLDAKNNMQFDTLGMDVLQQQRSGIPLTYVFNSQGDVLMTSFDRICRPVFEPDKQCINDPRFGENFRHLHYKKTDNAGNIYFWDAQNSYIFKATFNQGKFSREYTNLDELPSNDMTDLIELSDYNLLGRMDGLWKIIPENIQPSKLPQTWVQQIRVNNQRVYEAPKILTQLPLDLPANNNSVRFAFAANTINRSNELSWRSKLVGYDQAFSDWSSESWKDYTQLPSGDYQLIIQLRLRSGRLSEETAINFTVTTPLYLTYWAMACYFVIGVIALWQLLHWGAKRKVAIYLDKQKELEQKVHERTLEIEHKNARLAQQADKLTELDKAKSRFFANITHEFRTPLTLTIGPLQDCLSGRYGELNNKLKDALTLAKRRSEDLLDLVEELLDIARLDAGALPLHGQRIDLADACNQALAQLDSWALAKEISLTKHFKCNPSPINADPKQLSKVLTNLIGNAIKFTPENGKVNVQLSDDEDYYYIEVSDNGAGVGEEQIKQIFERFHQVGSNANISLGGVGLGLSLAKEITQMHGGDIIVRSALGHGASFTLKLPKHNQLPMEDLPIQQDNAATSNNTTPQVEPSSNTANHSASRLTMLIVEDDADLRSYIAEHFHGLYKVVCCSNGDSGVTQARQLLPDIIISDVMMPIMDGMELCKMLKHDPETDFIPIILLTARIDDSDRIDGYDVGADDYLAKPFSADVLKSRVANLINSRQKLLVHANEAQIILPVPDGLINREHKFVEQFQHALKSGLSDSAFSIEKLASQLYIDRTTLYKKVQATFHATPSELLIKARIEWACQLLKQDKGNIAEIAYTVGYNSVAHFSQSFKKLMAMTPSEYRNLQK